MGNGLRGRSGGKGDVQEREEWCPFALSLSKGNGQPDQALGFPTALPSPQSIRLRSPSPSSPWLLRSLSLAASPFPFEGLRANGRRALSVVRRPLPPALLSLSKGNGQPDQALGFPTALPSPQSIRLRSPSPSSPWLLRSLSLAASPFPFEGLRANGRRALSAVRRPLPPGPVLSLSKGNGQARRPPAMRGTDSRTRPWDFQLRSLTLGPSVFGPLPPPLPGSSVPYP